MTRNLLEHGLPLMLRTVVLGNRFAEPPGLETDQPSSACTLCPNFQSKVLCVYPQRRRTFQLVCSQVFWGDNNFIFEQTHCMSIAVGDQGWIGKLAGTRITSTTPGRSSLWSSLGDDNNFKRYSIYIKYIEKVIVHVHTNSLIMFDPMAGLSAWGHAEVSLCGIWWTYRGPVSPYTAS